MWQRRRKCPQSNCKSSCPWIEESRRRKSSHIHAYVVQHAISIGVDRIKCQTICVIYDPKRSGVNSMTGGDEVDRHINPAASDCWQCFRNLQHGSGLSEGSPGAAALSCPEYRQASLADRNYPGQPKACCQESPVPQRLLHNRDPTYRYAGSTSFCDDSQSKVAHASHQGDLANCPTGFPVCRATVASLTSGATRVAPL